MVQQDATVHKNVSADKHTIELPAFRNPMYDFGANNMDGAEVKENIYSFIGQAQETLESAADQSDL